MRMRGNDVCGTRAHACVGRLQGFACEGQGFACEMHAWHEVQGFVCEGQRFVCETRAYV